MKKLVTLLLAMTFALALTACGSQQAAQSTETQADSSAVETLMNEGALGDFHVKILDASRGTDQEGKAAVIVRYELTNNSDKSTSFMGAVTEHVLQNGAQLTYTTQEEAKEDGVIDAMAEVKPGETATVLGAYLLENDSSEIVVQCRPAFDLEDNSVMVTRTFNLA